MDVDTTCGLKESIAGLAVKEWTSTLLFVPPQKQFVYTRAGITIIDRERKSGQEVEDGGPICDFLCIAN